MQINSSHNTDPVSRTELYRRQGPSARSQTDSASFEKSEALNRSLRSTPDVRPEMVEHGRRLVEDSKWPPQEAINKIADLLAMKIGHETEPDTSNS